MSAPKPRVFWPLTVVAGVNDYIDFTINGGSEMSARIAAGVYLSCAALLAACETAVESVTDYSVVAVGDSAKGALSSNRGETWVASNLPLGAYKAVDRSGLHVVAVGATGACAISADGGATWEDILTLPAGDYHGVAMDGANVVAVGIGIAATSTDYGATWAASSIPAGDYYGVARSGANVVAVGANAGVAKCAISSNGGASWTDRASVIPSGTYWAVAMDGANVVAVGNAACAISSTSGDTWTDVLCSYNGLAVAMEGANVVVIGGGAYNCATSGDYGATWADRSSALGAGTYHGVARDGSNIVALGVGVAATSGNGGASWTPRTIPAGTYNAVALVAGGITHAWTASASETGKVTLTSDAPTSLRLSTGTHAATSARDVLGFGAVDTASGTTHTATNQHANGWYAPDPVINETPELPITTRVVTEALSGRSVAMEYGSPRIRKTVGLGFLPAYKVWQAEEGVAHLNESYERWFRDGWARFRWWPDAADEATYGDYLLAPKTAEAIPCNRLSAGNPLYSLTLEFRKYVA